MVQKAFIRELFIKIKLYKTLCKQRYKLRILYIPCITENKIV